MALLDIIDVTMNNALKGYIMNGVVNYTGSGAVSTTEMVMRVKTTDLNNVQAPDIVENVNFRFYDANAGGVRVTGVEVAIPAGRRVTGFAFYEVGQTPPSANIVVNLEGAEIKEFNSVGVLFIEVISIDLASVLI
jgi:hypothetical protein